AFPTARVVVFVDGCFWHACPQHATYPKVNTELWRDKLRRNQQRDAETDERLADDGWLVIRVWEHEDPSAAARPGAAAAPETHDLRQDGRRRQMGTRPWSGLGSEIARAVEEYSAETLAAYREAPRFVEEHANLERAAVEGGYGRRQLFKLIQNGADELVDSAG